MIKNCIFVSEGNYLYYKFSSISWPLPFVIFSAPLAFSVHILRFFPALFCVWLARNIKGYTAKYGLFATTVTNSDRKIMLISSSTHSLSRA
jgi:hypothetical protein